jgi:hypothetical protein
MNTNLILSSHLFPALSFAFSAYNTVCITHIPHVRCNTGYLLWSPSCATLYSFASLVSFTFNYSSQYLLVRSRRSSVWLRTARPGDRGSVLGPTRPPVQWVPGVLSPGVKRGLGVTLTTHPHPLHTSVVGLLYFYLVKHSLRMLFPSVRDKVPYAQKKTAVYVISIFF